MAGEAERVILEVALAQHSACTRAQLLERGLSGSTIDRRLRGGLLVAVGRGVYVLAGHEADHDAIASASLLVAPGAALSHCSAARRHGFPLPVEDPRPHLVVPHGSSRPSTGAAVHESRHLPAVDVAEVDGLATTTRARTLIDLAAELRPARLAHLVEDQLAAGTLCAAELIACHRSLARRGRRGTSRSRAVLEALLDDEPFPESRLELAMLRLLVDAGLTGFLGQHRPPWFDGVRGIVDFAHSELRLVLEVDGRRWHSTTQAFTDDRRRDRAAVAHGWRVLRYGWQEVIHRPDDVRRELEGHLGVRVGRPRG